MHDGPQFCASSATQAPEHMWKPALQLSPQAPLVHVAVLFGIVGQGVHEVVPQLVGLVSDTHAPEQT